MLTNYQKDWKAASYFAYFLYAISSSILMMFFKDRAGADFIILIFSILLFIFALIGIIVKNRYYAKKTNTKFKYLDFIVLPLISVSFMFISNIFKINMFINVLFIIFYAIIYIRYELKLWNNIYLLEK